MQMAKDLDAILDHGEANPAPNCITEDGSVSFLDKIIRPIYETMALVGCFSPLVTIINMLFMNFISIYSFVCKSSL